MITRAVAGGVLLLLAGAGISCSTKASASESSYCDAARQYAVYGLKHHGDGTPAAAKADNDVYMSFMDKGLKLAPTSLHADWVTYHAGAVAQTALMGKYGFDEARFDKEATETEKTALQGNPKVEAAFKNIIKYESSTCSSSQPPDADVSFDGEKPGAYCDAVKADNAHNETIDLGDPASVRKALTDPAEVKVGKARDAQFISTAPKVISDDVKAEVAWWNSKQKPALAKYGYDMAKLLVDGSAKERAALQLTDDKVANHYARATAYEHQVCGL